MNENTKQLEYIRGQLAWMKSKVELDNQLGLYDINKLGEDIFMHILNDVYDLNLKNANDILHDNFPSIDLVDENSKKVIQVTSTITLKKAKDAMAKFKELKLHNISDRTSGSLKNSISYFRKLNNYKEYQISFFYLKEKPNIKTDAWSRFLNEEGLEESNFIGIDDIIKIIQANSSKCEILYKTIQQRMDSISFKFNIDSYFESFEPHLIDNIPSKFKDCEPIFMDFINSNNKIFEVYAVGGNGKSHLLKYLASIEIKYIPLIFTKQINIEEDLKKLDKSKQYLFIFDDIDRFLDQPILTSLLSYTISNQNIKLMLSYRTSSQTVIKTIFRKYSKINSQELEVVWKEEEIELLISSLSPTLEKRKITEFAYKFNNNPYLITQAINGNLENIKDFSKKIIDDTKRALQDFNLNDKDIKDLLFEVSLLVPISKNIIEQSKQKIISILVDKKILRELASKYRFNPDMIGDLYLANYIDENKDSFEKIIEDNLKNFSDTLFTNLSYALVYNESDSLQNFIKSIIRKWTNGKEYSNNNLSLINKIVYYAPLESFLYLKEATKTLTYQQTNHHTLSGDNLPFVSTFAPPDGDWSSPNNAIDLESIEPIISKLIYALKNNIPCEELSIKHIIEYLTSEVVVDLPKPYYDNQTLDSIFTKMVSPLETRNFDVILQAIKIMETFLNEEANSKKFDLLKNVVTSLLSSTFDNSYSESIAFVFSQTLLNLQHEGVLKIIDYAKNILFKMLESDNTQILYEGLDSIASIGGHSSGELSNTHKEFYSNIQKEVLVKSIDVLKTTTDIHIISKIESVAINILRFSSIKNESLKVLGAIDRTDEYLFYQIIQDSNDMVILDYQKFYTSCMEQENINEWIYNSAIEKIDVEKPTIDEWKIIDSIASQYINYDQYISLVNILDINLWDSKNTLKTIFIKWLKGENKLFTEMAMEHLDSIYNESVKNIIKENLYQEKFITINIEDITQETTQETIRIYVNTAFIDYNKNSINILEKIIDVSKNKDVNYINWIIAIISGDMYFKIQNDITLYEYFEPIITKFLQWQLEYNLPTQRYIIHHILSKNILPVNKISSEIKSILKKIVLNEKIVMNEFDIKPIYKILEYGLNEVLENLYTKLTSKDEDQKLNHMFTHYFDYNKIPEVLLLKSYIKSYTDFKVLVNKVLEYYKSPIKFIGNNGNEYKDYINLDYFFKYTVKKEYIKQLFNELINKHDTKSIQILYKIVPISSEYIDVIIQNLNLLKDTIEDKELMNYLTQMGKIKVSSRGHMENSDLLLSEEDLFSKIYQNIESLSLQLKLKEELKYISIRKKKEIEEDISRLLDK